MKIALELANYVKAFGFDDLPSDVVHQSKRVLMDAIGCCIGAFDADASGIVHGLIKDLGGGQESTIIGSGLKTTCLNASRRFSDYCSGGHTTATSGASGPGPLAVVDHVPGWRVCRTPPISRLREHPCAAHSRHSRSIEG